MALNYRRLTEADLEVFIEMRIHQLREEGATEEMDLKSALRDYYHRHMADGTRWRADCGDKWYVLCGETAVFWLPQWKSGTAFQYVHIRGIPQTGHCKSVIDKGDAGSKRIWLWSGADHTV